MALGGLAGLLLALLPVTGPTTTAAPDTVALVGGERPSVSGDGRWMVFQREVDGRSTVFRVDRSDDIAAPVELSPVPDGVRSGDTIHPVLSADGCMVVVQTQLALDLFRDDDVGSRWDVYRLMMPECGGQLGRWELVSAQVGTGTARDDVDVTTPASVSESGSVVAFTHPIPGLRDTIHTISVVDLTVPIGAAERTTVLPAMPAEAPTTAYRYRGAIEPALSANGRHLAFTSDATSSVVLPEWGDGSEPGGWATPQVYVWDRHADDRLARVRMVSALEGTPSTGAHSPAISADGSVVAFVSADQSLATARWPRCGEMCPTQVFRSVSDPDGVDSDGPASRDGGVLSLVSAIDDGAGGLVAGDAPSWGPVVNVDASQVVFASRATNLLLTTATVAGGDGDGDLLVAEVPLGTLRRATDAAQRGPIAAAHAHPAVSATGRVLVFDTAVPAAFVAGEPQRTRHVATIVTEPRLSLAMLDFGTVLTGWSSDELYVSVLNEGPGAFAPGSARSTSPNFTVVDGGTCSRGLIVPAGGMCTVYVTFSPTAPSSFTGTIVVSEDRPTDSTIDSTVDSTASSGGASDVDSDDLDVGSDAEPGDASDVDAEGGAVAEGGATGDGAERAVPTPIDPVLIAATVVGGGGEPMLRADPAGLDLGDAVVGGPGERRAFDIRNVSSVPTEIGAVGLGGENPGDFVITSESCTDRALNPAATCTIEVEFRPTSAHRRTASLTASTVTGQYTAAIVGGTGRYEAEVVTAEPSVRAGMTLGVGLAGFPADSDVEFSFDDSNRVFATVRTDDDGRLLALIDVPRRERGGARVLVAAGDDGVVATTPLRVERRADHTPGIPGHGVG